MSALLRLSDYGYQFQQKVLNVLLKNKLFLLNIRDAIEIEYFDHEGNIWIVDELLKYFDKFGSIPTLEYFSIEVKKIDNEVLQIAIKEQLKLVYSLKNDDDEWVESEFGTFCINQKLKKALLSSVDLLNSGEYEEIRIIIDKALKAGQDKNVGHEYGKDIEERYKENSRKTIPTSWPLINSLLGGGLGGGDYALISGGPGGGKSWALIDIGYYAISKGYKVIHYTLELGAEYVGKRYDARATKIPVNEVDEHKDKIREHISAYSNNLIIREYPTKGATISTLKSHIQKCSDLGFEADLIILDYAELLKPPTKRRDKLEESDDIHYGLKGLAKELNIPIWSASQVNRLGASSDVVEGDKTAGSYNKQAIMDFGMSFSRLKKDKTTNKGRGFIQKNRYGPDGQAYNMNIDTSCGIFEFLEEYDDTEGFASKSQQNKFEVVKNEKEVLLSKFKDFKFD